MREPRGPRRSIWLTYSTFNPFSVVLRGPRSSSVLESFLANYPTARTAGCSPDCLLNRPTGGRSLKRAHSGHAAKPDWGVCPPPTPCYRSPITSPWARHERTASRRQPAAVLRRPARRDRSGAGRGTQRRTDPPAGRHRADRQRERRLRRGAGGARLRADQQIRRGLSGPALLRRLRVCRCRRAARDRPGEAAVLLRLRQRPAAFRRAGEPGGVPRPAAAGRHDPGHEPRRRRPPDPRRGAQSVRQVVPRRAVRRPARRRAAGLRGTGTAGARGEAEADHRRRFRLSALHRLRPHPPRGR